MQHPPEAALMPAPNILAGERRRRRGKHKEPGVHRLFLLVSAPAGCRHSGVCIASRRIAPLDSPGFEDSCFLPLFTAMSCLESHQQTQQWALKIGRSVALVSLPPPLSVGLASSPALVGEDGTLWCLPGPVVLQDSRPLAFPQDFDLNDFSCKKRKEKEEKGLHPLPSTTYSMPYFP